MTNPMHLTPLLDKAINELEQVGGYMREIRVSDEVPDRMLNAVIQMTGAVDGIEAFLVMVRRERQGDGGVHDESSGQTGDLPGNG
jgi:hypothetical protein